MKTVLAVAMLTGLTVGGVSVFLTNTQKIVVHDLDEAERHFSGAAAIFCSQRQMALHKISCKQRNEDGSYNCDIISEPQQIHTTLKTSKTVCFEAQEGPLCKEP